MQVEVAWRSVVGLVRTNNEDAAMAGAGLVGVSDGVGGRPAGEVASTTAVAVIEELCGAGVPLPTAIETASAVVRRLGAANSLFSGMCCTFTGVAFRDGGALLAHVGDSKAWLVEGATGEVSRLTEDQTIAARMVRDGELAPEDVATHPKRSTLYQVVGSVRALEIESRTLALSPGDRLVLATDGLDYAGEEQVRALSSKGLDREGLADALVDAALAAGGYDNITVVVADVVDVVEADSAEERDT